MQAHTQAALHAQLEAQQAQAQVPTPQADHGGPSIMERFKRMLPPSFNEESDPLLVESWMREIEKIFRAIRCAEDDKVTLATYMLQERADVWWSSLLHTRFEDGAVEISWDEFEGEMEQYLGEKKASQKRPAAPFQRQERKKVTFQSSQCPVASGSSQVPSQRSPSGQKECPHCGRAHGGTECWKLAGKCLKCGSSEHRIKDFPRLQQGGQRGAAPAPAAVAPTTGQPGRPRAPARNGDKIVGREDGPSDEIDCRQMVLVTRSIAARMVLATEWTIIRITGDKNDSRLESLGDSDLCCRL
ncbi:hypothetical protein Taro_027282 [Colocasia esculenta]|uniref:Gag protein n=1 Tax=Colocasia esculenta TaxID=4460 RepID=A0A843VDJ1_COLES|nr:hypothetical protein [Colocasia esculenta]